MGTWISPTWYYGAFPLLPSSWSRPQSGAHSSFNFTFGAHSSVNFTFGALSSVNFTFSAHSSVNFTFVALINSIVLHRTIFGHFSIVVWW